MKKNSCCETCEERLYTRQIPIFKSLSTQELEKVISLRKHIFLTKGEVLVQEGCSLDKLFIVSDGTIKITKSTLDGKEQIINLLSVGDFFGETNILGGATVSNISAISIKDSQVCTIAKADLENLIKQQPAIELALLEGVSKKLLELQNLTTHLADNPESRIACMLIEFCEKYSAKVDDNLSDKELLEILITDIVLLNEAKSRGITIQKEDVEKFMNENKKLIEADNEAMKKIKSICKKLGISEEKYWNNIVFDGYYERATIGAVRENITSNIKSNYNLDNYEEIEKKIELEINKIKKDYKIERY